MCGIAGKLKWSVSPDPSSVEKMCESLAHRGPDDSGLIKLRRIVLGHRRLSIIDLSRKAAQPMVSGDGRYYIVYNGEVYNFQEIRKELEAEGYFFFSRSDTEVVLYSYIKWGAACLEKFNGMFAFAIWDNQLEELFLARDRFGKKPLYYYIDSEKGISFASELTALVRDEEVPRNISYEALNCYLALGYILSPMSIYKDVFKLKPASFLRMTRGGKDITISRYWDYKEAFLNKTRDKKDTVAENILSLLDRSVKRRMISDVPIGAFLSGGIDSSSVVRMMKRHHGDELHTFSVGFRQESYDELPDANRVAKWLGTIHHHWLCDPVKEPSLIQDAINAYDEPFSDTSLIPTFEVSKVASSQVKVVLSGDGGDEIFAGYPTYQADKLYFYARVLPKSLSNILQYFPANIYRNSLKKLDWKYKQKKFFYGTLYSAQEAHYLWRIIFCPEERVNIMGEEFRQLIYDTDPLRVFKRYYEHTRGLSWLERHLYVDAMTWLTDDILVKVDRASMKNGIEVRAPYLDIELVNYAASVPAELKMKGLNTKYILKKSLKKILPDFIINKKKSGFGAPTGAWIGYEQGDEFKAFNRYVYEKKINNYLK